MNSIYDETFPIALPHNILQEKLEILDCGRSIKLEIKYGDKLKPNQDNLIFKNVVAYKTTYLYALTFEETEDAMINGVVKLSGSDWLKSVSNSLSLYNQNPKDYGHFKVYFERGQIYDFLCKTVELDLNKLC